MITAIPIRAISAIGALSTISAISATVGEIQRYTPSTSAHQFQVIFPEGKCVRSLSLKDWSI